MSEEKKKRTRITKTKAERYEEERKEVIRKLNEIMGINENNNKFILEELKEDKERQDSIMGLLEEVKKYYAYNTWTYFRGEVKEEAVSLMKAIYKKSGYDVVFRKRMINGKKVNEYIINKSL